MFGKKVEGSHEIQSEINSPLELFRMIYIYIGMFQMYLLNFRSLEDFFFSGRKLVCSD